MQFCDEHDSDITPPPSKRQKSDPNGIQEKDLVPIDVSATNTV